jgi:hypothetical protein
MKYQKKKLKESMTEFEHCSGCSEIDKTTFKEITQNLSEEDFDDITQAFYLLTKFYGGML